MIHIFHHNDPDGWCSAAIVLKYLADQNTKDGISLNECRYGMEFPWSRIFSNDVVYMVDFSLKPEEMERLNEMCSKFVWIDHHQNCVDHIGLF